MRLILAPWTVLETKRARHERGSSACIQLHPPWWGKGEEASPLLLLRFWKPEVEEESAESLLGS
eukprot:4716325-Pyramimonas_sp.AAC.1